MASMVTLITFVANAMGTDDIKSIPFLTMVRGPGFPRADCGGRSRGRAAQWVKSNRFFAVREATGPHMGFTLE